MSTKSDDFNPAKLLAASDEELSEKLARLDKERQRKGGRLISMVRQVEKAAAADDDASIEEQITNAEQAIAAYDAMISALNTQPQPAAPQPAPTPPAQPQPAPAPRPQPRPPAQPQQPQPTPQPAAPQPPTPAPTPSSDNKVWKAVKGLFTPDPK